MHESMLQLVIARCKQRIKQGDCPTVNAFTTEQLEEAVVELSRRLRLALDPNDDIEAGRTIEPPR